MGNPFTRFLNQSNPDEAFKRFTADWDDLEGLLIDVFRSAAASAEDHARWREITGRLAVSLPRAAEKLSPYRTETGDRGIEVFEDILSLRSVAEIVGNRATLQKLPDAREIINRSILGTDKASE